MTLAELQTVCWAAPAGLATVWVVLDLWVSFRWEDE